LFGSLRQSSLLACNDPFLGMTCLFTSIQVCALTCYCRHGWLSRTIPSYIAPFKDNIEPSSVFVDDDLVVHEMKRISLPNIRTPLQLQTQSSVAAFPATKEAGKAWAVLLPCNKHLFLRTAIAGPLPSGTGIMF
jgi:hypothetical protein